ncbi:MULTISPECIES: hypothetical protein [Limnochorda]|uniref:hypothetical protein n=1 Tax=Limnochorda TaxID=1676651 RepID=UPI0017D10E9F|nr:hypothetical protein [Limnochorda pilosa]MBO2486598.1 hypothetical protein [Bacillota bacterium]MBO2518490.1 hypothetical protein [Bacillota bacterium]NMA72211.1 hypothetical protein [Bacillota bacterium]
MRYHISLYFDISGTDPEDWVHDAFAALRDAGLLEYVRGELEEDYAIEPMDENGEVDGFPPDTLGTNGASP